MFVKTNIVIIPDYSSPSCPDLEDAAVTSLAEQIEGRVRFETCIVVVVIGRTGRDLDWVSGIPEVCFAFQNIASVVAFGDCLLSVEVRAEVDETIVEDEMAAELHEHQSLERRVAETPELVEVATSEFVARNHMDLRFDPCHPKVVLGLAIALTFDQTALRFAAYLARETEPEGSVGAEVASRLGPPLDAASPDLTTLVAEYCLR
jgi:hypothetical protein